MFEESVFDYSGLEYELMEQKGNRVWVRFFIDKSKENFKDVIMDSRDLKNIEKEENE